ncbi:MAG: diadenylate cyclase CdaA [Phycisphaeraceae bacterium]
MFERLTQTFIEVATRLRGYDLWEVLVELALIWLVIYMVFRFLRGTRGARVLRGFGMVVIIAAIIVGGLGGDSEVFARLRFLLGSFLTFAAFALVVVFQPELRRALVRLGEARLFRGTSISAESVIDEVIDAVEDLSRNKIGAIIALEREVGLEGIIEAGTRLDANVSAELLKTIFWPGSALHDMGVVIRADKIMAAGVQFPLAESDDINQELGSRHRAAMGLSQEADCLIIVVSEENGSISLAERGQLLRKLSTDGLRAMLRRGLSQGPPESKNDDDEEEDPGLSGKTAA